MISITELSKSYGNKHVLKGVNLIFEKGKVHGIVGENGAGKSTLFRCIAGLESHGGELQSDFKILKNHLGFLETGPHFISRITGWEYLRLVCVARGIDTTDFANQNIFDLPLNEYAENYSTGMKKKLALMGVLLQQNDVFILDEPFNGVDIHSNIMISEIISELKAKGKTILISSHIFSSLQSCCDQISLLKEGKILKSVTPTDYKELESEMKSFVIGDRIKDMFDSID